MPNGKYLAMAALVGAILCFSGNFMLGGIAVSSMPLMSLMYVKWGASAIPLLVVAHLMEKPDWREVMGHWKKIAVLSALGIAAYSLMFYQALRTTTPVNASLINAFNPALIALAAMVFLNERLTPTKVGGILVALLGVVWVLTGGDVRVVLQQGFNVGDLWMLGVISCWTAYSIVIRKGAQLPPLAGCALQMLFFTAALTPYTLANGLILPTTEPAMWSLAYIAVFPSAVAYALWNYGAKTVDPGQAGQFLNLVVPFTAVMTLLSGGSISSVEIVGGTLILLGVYLSSREPRTVPVVGPSKSLA